MHFLIYKIHANSLLYLLDCYSEFYKTYNYLLDVSNDILFDGLYEPRET